MNKISTKSAISQIMEQDSPIQGQEKWEVITIKALYKKCTMMHRSCKRG